MADKKWTPTGKLLTALSKLDEQQNGGKGLLVYGQDEHIAIIRYIVADCAPGDKLDRAMLKAELEKEAAFIGYASNARKLLIGAKMLPENSAKASGYE